MINYANPFPAWNSGNDSIIPNTSTWIELNSGGKKLWLSGCKSEWDTGHIGMSVYKIASICDVPPENTIMQYEAWECSLESPAVIWVRLASEAGEVIRSFENIGFRYISGLSTFIWATKEINSAPVSTVIRKANPREASSIGRIGAQVFVYDRLFLDPAIDRDTAVGMYKDWSANCVLGLCDTVLVAEVDGEIAGFISLNPDKLFNSLTLTSSNYQRIVLVAVSSRYRRRGLGRHLAEAAMRYCYELGFDYLLVGTSSLNIPAQNLYCSCGFMPYYSEISMEKLLNESG